MLRSLLFAVAFPILVLLFAVGAGIVEELVNRVIDYSFSGRSANPWAAGAVYLCLGAVIGFATADLLPRRLFPVKSPFSGISLLLAPFGTGLLMQFYGSWRRRHTRSSSWLATFWGGALFAFSIAFVRWIAVGRQ
jgi:hypothetical protein